MNEKLVQEIVENLRTSMSGIFATRESVEDATKYITELLTATDPEQLGMMTGLALGIYHNTLINQIGKMVDVSVHNNKPAWPTAEDMPEDGGWPVHDLFPVCDWLHLANNDDTRSSYAEWVNAELEFLAAGGEFEEVVDETPKLDDTKA